MNKWNVMLIVALLITSLFVAVSYDRYSTEEVKLTNKLNTTEEFSIEVERVFPEDQMITQKDVVMESGESKTIFTIRETKNAKYVVNAMAGDKECKVEITSVRSENIRLDTSYFSHMRVHNPNVCEIDDDYSEYSIREKIEVQGVEIIDLKVGEENE